MSADTLECYNPDQICDDCGKSPVQFIHWGSLTQNDMKKFCKECFKRRCEKEESST